MIKVNPEQIPESTIKPMARSLCEIIKTYFENPDNMRQFEEWKRIQKNQETG